MDLHDLNLNFVDDSESLMMVVMAACIDSPNNEFQVSKKAFAELKDRMKSLKPGNKPVLVAVHDNDGIRVKFMLTEEEVCDFVNEYIPN